MDQGAQFIKDQLSQGRSADQIKDLLRSNGWQEPQIQAAFASLRPVAVPTVPPPVPVAQKVVSASLVPEPAAEKTVSEPKKWLLPVILAVVTLLVLGGGLWAYQKYMGNKTSTEPTSELTSEPKTTVYSDANITFDYPDTWKYSTIAELNGETGAKSTNFYFFTPNNLKKAQQAIITEKANPSTDLGAALLKLGQIASYASFSIDHTTNATSAGCPTDLIAGATTDCVPFTSDKTAKSVIEVFLKTTYGTDGATHYDSSTVVDPTRVQTTVVNGVTAYWGVNGPAGSQSVELAVPTTNGAEIFTFNGVTDITNLRGEVSAVFNSIKAL